MDTHLHHHKYHHHQHHFHHHTDNHLHHHKYHHRQHHFLHHMDNHLHHHKAHHHQRHSHYQIYIHLNNLNTNHLVKKEMSYLQKTLNSIIPQFQDYLKYRHQYLHNILMEQDCHNHNLNQHNLHLDLYYLLHNIHNNQ